MIASYGRKFATTEHVRANPRACAPLPCAPAGGPPPPRRSKLTQPTLYIEPMEFALPLYAVQRLANGQWLMADGLHDYLLAPAITGDDTPTRLLRAAALYQPAESLTLRGLNEAACAAVKGRSQSPPV